MDSRPASALYVEVTVPLPIDPERWRLIVAIAGGRTVTITAIDEAELVLVDSE